MKYRKERLIKALKEEVGKSILKKIDQREAVITITGIKLNERMDKAEIEISIFPANLQEKMIELLNQNKKIIRRIAMKNVPIKFFPQIEFRINKTLQNK